MEHLAKRTTYASTTIYSLQNSTLMLFQLSPSQFHKKLNKANLFAASYFLYLTLPPTRTNSLVFDPGFVFVNHSHFHLSFIFTSFAAFYFMDELGLVLLNKPAFFMFGFLQHFKSFSVTLISHVHFISCHFMF